MTAAGKKMEMHPEQLSLQGGLAAARIHAYTPQESNDTAGRRVCEQ